MNRHTMVNGEHSPKEVLKFVLVIVAIVTASLLLTKAYGPQSLTGWMRWFMGVFFIVFAGFKLIGYRMFVMMFAGYDIIAKRYKIYGYLYPFIELVLGLAYVFDLYPIARDVLTVLVMGISSIGVWQELQKRSGIHCACLGNVIKLPLSTVSFIEDAAMGLMAAAMIGMRLAF